MTLEEPSEIYEEEQFKEFIRDPSPNEPASKKKKSKSSDVRKLTINKADLMFSPQRAHKKFRKPSDIGRSNSFHSDVNTSLPFGSMINKDSHHEFMKKSSKFKFLNKLSIKKEKNKKVLIGNQGSNGLNNVDSEIEQENLIQSPRESKSQSKTPKAHKASQKQELSDVFDTRASNPIHVNNLFNFENKSDMGNIEEERKSQNSKL